MAPATEIKADLENLPYFKSISWCAEIIEDPRYSVHQFISRIPKVSGEDSFFSETLQTNRTIRRCLSVHSHPDDSLSLPIQESMTFFQVGDGVNGYPGVCHGGFVATLLDEIMGLLLNLNLDYQISRTGKDMPMNHMTGYLNTKYLAPVIASGDAIILGTARVERVEGRKFYIRGTLEDSNRKICTVSECLYIQARKDPRALI